MNVVKYPCTLLTDSSPDSYRDGMTGTFWLLAVSYSLLEATVIQSGAMDLIDGYGVLLTDSSPDSYRDGMTGDLAIVNCQLSIVH